MNRLKERLQAGEIVTAAWSEMGSPDNAEAMAMNGWPTIVIDGEHGVGGIEQAVHVARAVEAAGGDVVMRVPDGSETTLKRVLDRGIRSIIVPQVNTAAQAKSIADFCRYPGRGRRGYAAPILRASRYGARPDYAARAHEELLLMVQIEHVEAVENLKEIAAVPGIDMLFVGPNDLAASIDHMERMEEPAPQELLKRIEKGAAEAGKPLGTIVGAGRGMSDLARLGYRFIIGPNDVSLLVNSARAAAAERDRMLSEFAGRTETSTSNGAPTSNY
ncbi:aldolase/citrate lyase family protein [Aquamicrobium sp. LC103]|uniref:HpcH/HpaI aldolase family protein n=1 Tax=Aquamicrobium sp. LC103 TaxID=1120658 RepID=UPI00063EB6EE|nr:aldolase/citrate lyase family protein [Aquamicrobium sp. LC103]TKT76325.1 aldolase [Aquamicrobium sp. LC103]